MFPLSFYVVFAVSTSLHCAAGLTANYTQNVESNTTVVLVCAFDVDYSMWRGPPLYAVGSLTTYNYPNSSKLNPNIGPDKLQRMGWADNKRDLVLYPVTRADDGNYECFDYELRRWAVLLTVRGI